MHLARPHQKPSLSSLIEGMEGFAPLSVNPVILGISCDSRTIEPGFLFAAFAGSKTDGGTFIQQAVSSGALAILCLPDQKHLVPESVAVLCHPNPRQAFAHIAARFYARQPEHTVAVTGTNGKTSTVHFYRELLKRLGHNSASIGTIGVTASNDKPYAMKGASLTTSDAASLHAMLAALAEDGITHLAMEASSHGISQHRLDGVKLAAAAFTSFSRDHLDYHLTEEAYFEAKAQLFTRVLVPSGTAVLNADIKEYAALKALCDTRGIRVLDYGKKASALRLLSLKKEGLRQHMEIGFNGKIHTVTTTLPGDFQAANLLCALGLALATGEKPEQAIPLLGSLPPVPGRMEQVMYLPNHAAVFIDYAHTPDALEKALNVLRPLTQNLWVVFGCGGDRDTGKRPQMGEIAKNLADTVLITDDNPRSENPAAIRAAIKAACPRALEIGDRREAIAYALSHVETDGIVLIAGKGHETTQTIGQNILHFNDAEVIREEAKKI